MVTQKISALDEESRQMLDQVSAIGEDVSLSVLAGTTEHQEARVLEFIDHAVSQGLLSSQYKINDEVVRFLGKRILHATYNAIEEERKQQLHQRIGNYQESLYNQKLLPSASPLTYHFKRSADRQKAIDYEMSRPPQMPEILTPTKHSITRLKPRWNQLLSKYL